MITPQDEQRVREKLSLGRAYVLSRADYYSSILLEMSVEVVSNATVTMGVTKGLVLYVNGEWLLNDPEMQTDEVIGGCLVHECEHPLRGLDRLEALPDKALANIAGDEAINFNLREEQWQLPSWVVYPERYGHPPNLTLEQYYALLSDQLLQENKTLEQLMADAPQGGGGTKGNGKNKNKGSGLGNKQQKQWTPKIGAGGCGSAGGYAVDESLEAELDTAYGKGPSEVESARRQTFDAIEKALESGKGCGNIPGRFKELLKIRYQVPDVNWRSFLRRILQRALERTIGDSDYSLSNPSLGGQLAGCITSGLVDQKINVVIAEDTSSSMGEPQLLNARSEAYHLIRAVGIDEAIHIQSDMVVQHEKRIRLRDLPKLAYHGRGGTDFNAVFERVNKRYPETNLLVYFTDGDGRAPAKPPRNFDVVWCIIRTEHARRPAHWGHVVVCDKNQKLEEPY